MSHSELDLLIDANSNTKWTKSTLKLRWEILEHKCRYYMLHDPCITDKDYDLLCRQYDTQFNKDNPWIEEETGESYKINCEIVGFNPYSPSGSLVYNKLIGNTPPEYSSD